jgi:N-methylhydantoinase B
MFGEGRRIPAVGAAGAKSELVEKKVGRLELRRGGETTIIRNNVIDIIKPGETVTNFNPGGGGYGDPLKRPIHKVLQDIRNGLVSIEGAREDYGVVVSPGAAPEADLDATQKLRQARA